MFRGIQAEMKKVFPIYGHLNINFAGNAAWKKKNLSDGGGSGCVQLLPFLSGAEPDSSHVVNLVSA